MEWKQYKYLYEGCGIIFAIANTFKYIINQQLIMALKSSNFWGKYFEEENDKVAIEEPILNVWDR